MKLQRLQRLLGNPKGRHRERWVHSQGCRRWFNVERHTVSHEITAVYEMGKPPPKAPSKAPKAPKASPKTTKPPKAGK